jgi:hypothetical protein
VPVKHDLGEALHQRGRGVIDLTRLATMLRLPANR